jgi:hypothetical protein
MANDCEIIVDLWKNYWNKTTTVDGNELTACCYYLGSTTQTSGIPGVTCTSDGKVTRIEWSYQFPTGSIPPEIGNLKNLNWL